MQKLSQRFTAIVIILATASSAIADQEASNVAHVASGTHGRCYAKSIPTHVYDPSDAPRQHGRTFLYQVANGDDVLVHEYDWFSQNLFVKCGPSEGTVVVRLGPWQRGHDPKGDHLAVAFYKGGTLIRSYSTLDIAGDTRAENAGMSSYQNASASVSHYTVFSETPKMVLRRRADGPLSSEQWIIQAVTIDGRVLRFDMETGELL